MIIADIGNTNVKLHIVSKSYAVTHTYRLPTDPKIDYEDIIKETLGDEEVGYVMISSVVPEVTKKVSNALKILYGIDALVLTRDDFNMKISDRIAAPYSIGIDRLADSYYALLNIKLPAVTVDLGTATTVNLIDKNGVFMGGMIAAGVATSLRAISAKGALLPEVILDKPDSMIGTDTVDNLQSGAVYGAAAMVQGIKELIEAEISEEVSLVITGGYAKWITKILTVPHIYEPDMMVKGLIEVYRNML